MQISVCLFDGEYRISKINDWREFWAHLIDGSAALAATARAKIDFAFWLQ
jgi:hypothetical protein